MQHGTDQDIWADVEKLTIKEILHVLQSLGLSVPRQLYRQRKSSLLRYVFGCTSEQVVEQVLRVALQKAKDKGDVQMRERESSSDTRHKFPRTESLVDVGDDVAKYLEVPDAETVRTCHRKFYHATSNASVSMAVCAVCARERQVVEEGMMEMNIMRLPNVERLKPKYPHAAHELVDGKLLEPMGVKGEGGEAIVKVCLSCLDGLEQDGKQSPPKLSLANNMWIGCIPWELQHLTFLEQLLIALLYPQVFVFKLYPKHGVGSSEQLQWAMKGNVSTYNLNIEGISTMIVGDLMPRPPAILASIISVTVMRTHYFYHFPYQFLLSNLLSYPITCTQWDINIT
jgi:hypothetical protein